MGKPKVTEVEEPTTPVPANFSHNSNSFPALPDQIAPRSSSTNQNYAGKLSYTASKNTFPSIGTPVIARKALISYKPKKTEVVVRPKNNFPRLDGTSEGNSSKEKKV